MNYLHAFHAGNHTEVFKHAALSMLIGRLKLKPSPFVVVDTHAGAGVYDLGSDESTRTGEAVEGIRRIYGKSLKFAKPYLDVVQSYNRGELRIYPGSPAIIRALLRENDRMIACETRESEYSKLKLIFKSDERVSLHHRDGYEAMRALVPPKERRGIVFIDPPYESKSEKDDLIGAVIAALKKWPTGIFMAWYPIKDRLAGRKLVEAFGSVHIEKILSAEFIPFPDRQDRLAGSGLVICNTPWQFDVDMKALSEELMQAFAVSDGRWTVNWAS